MSELGKIGNTDVWYTDFVENQEESIKKILESIKEAKVTKMEEWENADSKEFSLLVDFGIGFEEWMDVYNVGKATLLDWNEYIFNERDVRDIIIRAINNDDRIWCLAEEACYAYLDGNNLI